MDALSARESICMIELIVESRCTACNICVEVCPRDVLIPCEGHVPVIAHQSECQTCFLCELYCKTDAIYVHPDASQSHPQDTAHLEASGLLGEYRRNSGWDEWAGHKDLQNQHWRMEDVFRRARSP